jgi:hypothetical protein
MQERLNAAIHDLRWACDVPGKCLVSVMTVLLGAAFVADAFVVPCLFGGVAAVVIACERVLCATRASSFRAGAAWTVIALGWVALAACMLHTPLMIVGALRWLLVLLIASSALCRLWLSPATAVFQAWEIGLIGVAIVVQLAMLFGSAPSLSRVAASIGIELALIGTVGLLRAADAHLKVRDTPAQFGYAAGSEANPALGLLEFEAKAA